MEVPLNQEKPCVFCGDPAEMGLFSQKSEFDTFWVTCSHCGSYAITHAGKEQLAKLSPDSHGRLNLIAYTYSHQSRDAPFGLTWKARGERIEVLPPQTAHDIEDHLDEPIQHARKPDELLRLIATAFSDRNPFQPVALGIAE